MFQEESKGTFCARGEEDACGCTMWLWGQAELRHDPCIGLAREE